MNSLLFAMIAANQTVNVHIEGEGWMRFSREGRTVFAREATLTVVKGRLASGDAFVLPTIAVGEGADIKVSRDGTVTANGSAVGKLAIAMFVTQPTAQSGSFFTSPDRPTLSSAETSGAGYFASTSSAPKPQTPNPNPSPVTRDPKPETRSGVQIRVRRDTEVSGKTFTLAEIADLNLPKELLAQVGQIVVGDTPPLGIARKIDRDRLMIRLRVSGFDPNAFSIEIPADAVVHCPNQQIEHSRFLEVALAAIKPQVGEQAQITDLNPQPPLVIAPGDITLTALSPSINGTKATIRVEVRLNGVVTNSRTLQFSVTGKIPLPKVGTMVTVRAKSGGVKVQFSAKVTATSGLNQIEVVTAEGTKLTGILAEPGVVEIIL